MSKWISVEDKLPVPWQTVLVYCKFGSIHSSQFYGKEECERSNYRLGGEGRFFFGKYGRWFESAEKGYVVTHWMPLPPPPKDVDK